MTVFSLLADATPQGMQVFSLVVAVMAIAAVLLSIAFYIWMLVDCIKNEPSEGNDKIVWLLVILFLQGLGALIYYFARRPARIKGRGKKKSTLSS